jgi:hypothetical protein
MTDNFSDETFVCVTTKTQPRRARTVFPPGVHGKAKVHGRINGKGRRNFNLSFHMDPELIDKLAIEHGAAFHMFLNQNRDAVQFRRTTEGEGIALIRKKASSTPILRKTTSNVTVLPIAGTYSCRVKGGGECLEFRLIETD